MLIFPLISNPAAGPQSFQAIIESLGLTSGLQAVFDAGDGDSYGGTGETLTDTNGSDDCWFGTSGSTSGDEPTFNGTAGGLSSAEYFSTDGADLFKFKSQPAWIEAFHKNNATFTIAAVIYHPSGSGDYVLIGNKGNVGGGIGFQFGTTGASHNLNINFRNGTTSTSDTSSAGVNESEWAFVAISIDEGGGASASFFRLDSNNETFDGAISSPSASSATYTTEIMASGNQSQAMASGTRLGCLAIWNTNLSATNLADLETEIMARFA